MPKKRSTQPTPISVDATLVTVPIYRVPDVVHNVDIPKETELSKAVAPVEIKKPDFDMDKVIHDLRSGAGFMQFKSALYANLQGRGTIVIDGMDGRNHLCHIEVDGFRIPPEPDDYFKY
jgi:hypothetical protein